MKKIYIAVVSYIKRTDKTLILLSLFAALYGCIAIAGIVRSYNTVESSKFYTQVIAVAIGVMTTVIVSLIDYNSMSKLWKLHMPVCFALVILTFFIGVGPEGIDDKAWLILPGNISLQPSELLKISFILTFSLHLSNVKTNINSFFNVLLLLLHAGIPIGLVFMQGDDGSALIFIAIFLCMLFSAGISWKYIAASVLVTAISVPIFWNFLIDEDKQKRISSLFSPGTDILGIEYQQILGLTSMGTGQIWGKGLFSGEHIHVPMVQNDFIITFIGESLGFVGCVTAMGFILAICIRILIVSFNSKDFLGSMICVGVFAMIASQTVINIGMCLKVLPVIGVTLPFFSSGGTSVISLFLSVGLVASVHLHNKVSIFDKKIGK